MRTQVMVLQMGRLCALVVCSESPDVLGLGARKMSAQND